MVIRDSERVEVLKAQGQEMLLNLSHGGAAFLYSRPLPKDQVIVMRINDTFIDGLVMYCHQRTDGYRIGVCFSGMGPEAQAMVNGMIDAFSCGVPLQFSVEDEPVLKHNVYE
ncbi:MAG: PilZ domain-containing protein [Chitinispirillaceae bacterium]|nr:PilZ domain-containing protein [Chitinispirillaceae bacterium]